MLYRAFQYLCSFSNLGIRFSYDPDELSGLVIGQRSDGWVKRGRSPSPGNASKIVFMAPYRSVNEMQYDFRVE